MKYSLTALFLFLPIFGISLSSCFDEKYHEGNTCDDVDTSKAGPFDLSNIFVSIYHHSNGVSLEQPAGLDILDKNIEIVINTEQTWLSSYTNLLDILIPKANACTLIPPYGASNVAELKVTLIAPSGDETDVSDFFDVVSTSEQIVQGLPMKVSNFVALAPAVSRSYILQANESVQIQGEFTVRVTLYTSSGFELSSSEGPFYIISNP